MIVTTDIANIIFKDCKAFGISEMYQRGNIPEGEVKTERIVIYPKAQQPDAYWEKGYVEVNLCVPVTKTGKANLIRLNDLKGMQGRCSKMALSGNMMVLGIVTLLKVSE